jgi:hypothetical protein
MPQSYIEYTSGLSETTFSVPFNYINSNDVNALGFDGVDYVALSVASVNPTAKTVTLTQAPSSYTKLRVYRASSTQQLVDFQSGSRLSESDLDTAYQQGLFVAQEVAEDANTNQYVAISDAAQTAVSVATVAAEQIIDDAVETAEEAAANAIATTTELTETAVADAETAAAAAIQAALQAGTRLTNFASHEVVSDATDGLIDGTNTVFNITSFPPRTETPEAYRVTIDGIMQSPTDAYTIGMNPDIITFSSAPPVGSKIVVVTAASAATAVSVDNTTLGLTSTNRAEVKDGGITNDKLAGGITHDKLADVIDDDTMATASNTTLATSESIKAYVDNLEQLESSNDSFDLLLTTTPHSVSGGVTSTLDLSSIIGANRALVHLDIFGDGIGDYPNNNGPRPVGFLFKRQEGSSTVSLGYGDLISDGEVTTFSCLTADDGTLDYLVPYAHAPSGQVGAIPGTGDCSAVLRAYQIVK